MEDLVNPWRGRRVFLTGHTGFKGSWLSLWLSRRGALLRGYALSPETAPNLFSSASVASVVDDVRGDVRDCRSLEDSMAGFAPEVVFHLAAQPLVRRSYDHPLETYSTNVMGTVHLLEAVRKTPSVRAVVCVTTDKCYLDQPLARPFCESDALGGYDPYSSSKACAEIVSAAYRNSFFPLERFNDHRVALATARAGNVIGGGDWSEDRLIPDLIRGFEAGQPVLLRRPGAIRPWQHVLEPLHGYLRLAEQLLANPANCAASYNFGPDYEEMWTVGQVADRLVGLWGDGAQWRRDPDPGPHESHTLRLDSSKARAELAWRPRLNTGTSLEWTVDWYRSWRKGADMQQETLAQIAAFELLHA